MRTIKYPFLAMLFISVIVVPLSTAVSVAGDDISVVTTLAMLADITAEIGQPFVTVTHLVPGLGSPHSFEPTIKHLKFFQDADLFVQVGLGLEPWSNQLIDSADNRRLTVVSLGQGPDDNPHIWLDEPHLGQAVMRLQTALATVMPQHKEYFATRAGAFLDRVRATFSKYRSFFGDRSITVVTTVPTYSYLLKDLGIRELGPLEEGHGDPPSAREVADLVTQAAATKAIAVITESGFDHGFGQILAEETGLPLITLHPLPTPGEDYVAFLTRNLEPLLQAVIGVSGND